MVPGCTMLPIFGIIHAPCPTGSGLHSNVSSRMSERQILFSPSEQPKRTGMNGEDRIAHTSGWSTFGKTRQKMKCSMYYTAITRE